MTERRSRVVTGRVAIGSKRRVLQISACGSLQLLPRGFTPRHAHEWEHEILVHAGIRPGPVFKNGEWHDVSSGSAIFIPGNEDHQLRNNGDGEFVFACLIPKGAPEL